MNFIASIRNALVARLTAALNPMSGAPRAPADFVQHRNPTANARRHMKRQMGARQFRKMRKHWQATANAARARNTGD